MEKHKIFIITANYPYRYNGGEITFIESELDACIKKFQPIFVPIHPYGPRVDDDQYLVDLSLSTHGFCSKVAGILRHALLFPYLLPELIIHFQFDFKYLSRLVYIASRIRMAKIWTRKIIQSEGCGVVFYTYWFSHEGYGIADEIKGTSNVIITRAHGGDLYNERRKYGRHPYREYFIHKYDAIFPISKKGRDYILERFVLDQDKVITSYLGTYDHGYITSPPVKSSKAYIVSCSYINPIKQVDRILGIVSEMSKMVIGYEVEWVHFGGGSPTYQSKIIEEANKKKQAYRIMGTIPNSEIMNFYRENPILCFINFSVTEGIPVSIMEAISFGIPVVAPDVGAISEIVCDSTGVLLASTDSDREAALKIATYLSTDSSRDRHTIRCFWLKNFSEKNNDTFYSIVNTILNQKCD